MSFLEKQDLEKRQLWKPRIFLAVELDVGCHIPFWTLPDWE